MKQPHYKMGDDLGTLLGKNIYDKDNIKQQFGSDNTVAFFLLFL